MERNQHASARTAHRRRIRGRAQQHAHRLLHAAARRGRDVAGARQGRFRPGSEAPGHGAGAGLRNRQLHPQHSGRILLRVHRHRSRPDQRRHRTLPVPGRRHHQQQDGTDRPAHGRVRPRDRQRAIQRRDQDRRHRHPRLVHPAQSRHGPPRRPRRRAHQPVHARQEHVEHAPRTLPQGRTRSRMPPAQGDVRQTGRHRSGLRHPDPAQTRRAAGRHGRRMGGHHRIPGRSQRQQTVRRPSRIRRRNHDHRLGTIRPADRRHRNQRHHPIGRTGRTHPHQPARRVRHRPARRTRRTRQRADRRPRQDRAKGHAVHGRRQRPHLVRRHGRTARPRALPRQKGRGRAHGRHAAPTRPDGTPARHRTRPGLHRHRRGPRHQGPRWGVRPVRRILRQAQFQREPARVRPEQLRSEPQPALQFGEDRPQRVRSQRRHAFQEGRHAGASDARTRG